MALDINPSLLDNLPGTVKAALSKMSPEQQSLFCEEYQRKSKSTGLCVALAILFPIQLFLLGKTGLGIVFWLTGGALGIWWLVEIFLTPKRVRAYNADVATAVVRDMKIMQS